MVKHFHLERTDPTFVRSTTTAHVTHRHLLFGTPVTRRRPMRDADGSFLRLPVGATCTLREALDPWSRVPENVRAQARLMRSRGSGLDDEIDYIDPVRTRLAGEHVTLGVWADFCTAAMAVTRTGELAGYPGIWAPCTGRPLRWESKYPHPPDSDDRRLPLPRAVARRKARKEAAEWL